MRGRWAVLAVLLLALTLAACGGDDDEGEAEDGANGDEAVTEEADESELEPEPTEEPEPDTYEVQRGDTLSGIAEEFGVTVEDLVETNDLDDPDVLYEGQELVIP